MGNALVQTLLLAVQDALVLLPGTGIDDSEELFGGHILFSLLCKYQELFPINLVNQIDAR